MIRKIGYVSIAFLLFAAPAFATTSVIQSVSTDDLLGNATLHNFGSGFGGTYNQTQFIVDQTFITDHSWWTYYGLAFSVFDGVSTTTYAAATSSAQFSYDPGTGVVTACIINDNTGQGPLTITPSNTDDIYIEHTSGGTSHGKFFGQIDGSSNHLPYFVLSYNPSDCAAATLPDTSTRFISVTPYDGETIATSSTYTVGGHVYISPDDFEDGEVLDIGFDNETVDAVTGISAYQAFQSAGQAFSHIQFPLTEGDNNLSTTTTITFNGGITTMSQKVLKPTTLSSLPVLDWFFSPNTLIATTTTFTLGTSTSLDQIIHQGGDAVVNYLLTGTTTNDVLDCNPTSFHLTACLVSIIWPSNSSIQSFLASIQGQFLSKPPFGYITRTLAIFNSTATSTLPELSVTVPAGYPGAGESVDFSAWNVLGTGSILDTATSTDGRTFREVAEPYWLLLLGFFMGLAILHDLLGLRHVYLSHKPGGHPSHH